MAENKPPSFFPNYEMVCNLVIFIMGALSAPFETLFHYGRGERSLGINGLLGIFVLILDATLTNDVQAAAPMLLLALIFFVRFGVHRVLCIRKRYFGGPHVHSRFVGHPILGLALRKVPAWGNRILEALILVLSGWVVTYFNRPLGEYMVLSGVCLFGIDAVRSTIAYNKFIDALDAQCEQRVMADKMQGQQFA